MHWTTRALLFTIAAGLFGTTALLAQRGGIPGALPSSTAIGAGALSRGPSATAASTGPARGYIAPAGSARPFRYANTYGYSNGYNYSNRRYRPLPSYYVAAPFYYPYFDASGGTDYSNAPSDYGDYGPGYGYGPDPATDQLAHNQAAIGAQVQRLTDQMNSMMYGPGGYPAPQPQAQQQAAPAPPITVVLRSGEKLSVDNYAVTDNTFWDFTQHGTRKIPLSSIDLSASAKATEDSGGEFPQIQGAK